MPEGLMNRITKAFHLRAGLRDFLKQKISGDNLQAGSKKEQAMQELLRK